MQSLKLRYLVIIAVFLMLNVNVKCADNEKKPLNMVALFSTQSTVPMIAKELGWFEEYGLKLNSFETFITGVAMAGALAKGNIDAGFTSLVPAINSYANGGVPLKIIGGTHKYGFSLIVDPEKVKKIQDLGDEKIRVGCLREGTVVDLFMISVLEKYELNVGKIQDKTRRMNQSALIMAMQSGNLDAIFLPEHWATIAVDRGFKRFLEVKDIWPDYPAGILFVMEDLPRENIEALKKINDRFKLWIKDNRALAGEILAKALSMEEFDLSADIILKSMDNFDFFDEIKLEEIQKVIDYSAKCGYIKKSFPAEDIVLKEFF